MQEATLSQFHLLRPEWLWALLPAVLLVIYFWRRANSASSWQHTISAELLPHLLDKAITKQSRLPWLALGMAWVLTIVALSGPTWNKIPQPVHKKESALVVVLDLSISMLATDLKPTRLVKARHKIIDILNARKEGLTALVAYSGDAHGVIPLTDDSSTITAIVPSLEPGIMPKMGSNTEDAIDKAINMLKDGGASKGKILLVTDGVEEDAANTVISELKGSPYKLAILGVGTADGSPIAAPDGNFLKDSSGAIVIPKLDRDALTNIASAVGGKYADIQLDDTDSQYLLNDGLELEGDQMRLLEREFDIWYERGPYLLLLLLPLAAMGFRRGWLLGLMAFLLIQPQPSYALDWADLWQRPDQQAAKALEAGKVEEAAQKFEAPQWKGTAHYRSNNYEEAIKDFAKENTADADYNRGNALAKAGKLDDAIKAYENALAKQPELEDAAANKKLVEDLKKQQEKQDQDKKQDSDQKDSDENKSDQQKSDNQSQQNQNSQNQDQKNQDQQNKDQKNSSQESDSQENQEQDSDDKEQQSQQAAEEQEKQEQEQKAQAQKEQEKKEQEQKEQAAQQEASEDETKDKDKEQQAEEQPPTEQQQATEQWLRRVPEDPAGLMRRKFNYEYQKRLQEREKNRFMGKDDDEELRW